MPRDSEPLVPGDWLEEMGPRRRRMQVMAVHSRSGLATANVELAVDGNPVDRLSLSAHALSDPGRFRRVR